MERFYKLAMPTGYDFYTGNTINYRENIGKFVKPPNANKKSELCSSGLIHASRNINDCFVGAEIPCSGYVVEGKPYAEDSQKCGFIRLKVVEEIRGLDTAFGWKYSEAINPINPLKIQVELTQKHKDLLRLWASVRASVWDSVWASVGASVWDSVWDSVWAYIGSMFPNIKKWKYIEHEGTYPFQACVDLWKDGFVASYDGKIWRLHSGKKAEIVYEVQNG